ncbi:MAG: hypothetical protein GYA24_03250 [Candidatus Lokiarchaeota archaeon]|nr:hypothetical protein [Candidatus Lokiarchaeota archaeon]
MNPFFTSGFSQSHVLQHSASGSSCSPQSGHLVAIPAGFLAPVRCWRDWLERRGNLDSRSHA